MQSKKLPAVYAKKFFDGMPVCQINCAVISCRKNFWEVNSLLKKFFLTLAAIFFVTANAHAETILFVPHDNRPVSSQQPAEVVAQLGYEILMPPEEFLTNPR